MTKYRVIFTITDGRFLADEVVEIEAETKESACNGAFKTKVYPKYCNLGCRFLVDKVEIIDEAKQ